MAKDVISVVVFKDGWGVKESDSGRIVRLFPKREEAIEFAEKLAKEKGFEVSIEDGFD